VHMTRDEPVPLSVAIEQENFGQCDYGNTRV
jgi:hypothetical protein